MNQHLKSIILSAASLSGVLALRRQIHRSQFRIVTYHGVDARTHPVINFDRLQADPVIFTRQIEEMARVFRVVDLHEAILQFTTQGTWPERALAVTFDDGYRNNLEVAAPILHRLGIPATFFVTAGFVRGQTSPWWYALRQWIARSGLPDSEAKSRAVSTEAYLRPMSEAARAIEFQKLGVERGGEGFHPLRTTEECRKLISMGFDIQCHGDTHASFAAESTERVVEEIRKSVEFINGLGKKPWGLAYPYGHQSKHDEAAIGAMDSCGLIAAFTTKEGYNGRRTDRWGIRRWDVHGGYSAAGVLARVS